jgi:hypothetical protein
VPTCTAPLIQLLSTGEGRWYVPCYWCHASSPSWPAADELHILGGLQAEGWTVRERGAAPGTGRYVAVCRACQRVR